MTRVLVCLDLDGCLVDSSRAVPAAINAGLEALGLRARPVTELERFIGPPLVETFRSLLLAEGADADLAPDAVEAYRLAYARDALSLTEVVTGLPDALDVIAAQGAELVVVTSKPAEPARWLVGGLGLDRWIVAVHGPALDALTERKEVTLRRALDHHRAVPDRAVMVGDRRHDVEAGRALGVRTVGVTWGAGDRAELERAAADVVLDDPALLPASVLRRRLGP